jgi:hypothetical protein
VRMGGAWNWLRMVSMVEFSVNGIETASSATRNVINDDSSSSSSSSSSSILVV